MNVNKLASEYHISVDEVYSLIEAGIISNDKEVIHDQLQSCICLKSIGLDTKMMKQYCALTKCEENTTKEQILILLEARKLCMQRMHAAKEKLDCLEYVLEEQCRK